MVTFLFGETTQNGDFTSDMHRQHHSANWFIFKKKQGSPNQEIQGQ